jgi:hypothetical protein
MRPTENQLDRARREVIALERDEGRGVRMTPRNRRKLRRLRAMIERHV